MNVARNRLVSLSRQLSTSTMAPVPKHYDFIVIGGGSGGVATARRAAQHGAKTVLIEGAALGGTCVNVGCVPKKVMWYASDIATKLDYAKNYGFSPNPEYQFDWPGFKAKRDAYVKRLNGIYERNLANEGVEYVRGWADFVDPKKIKVALNDGGEAIFTADHVLIATGGKPAKPTSPEGAEHGLVSDDFFKLETQPKSVAIIGAGYIAVEFAGMFNHLGTETHLCVRHDYVLRNFDEVIGRTITEQYIKDGINVHTKTHPTKIEKLGENSYKVHIDSGKTLEVEKVIWAVGRQPLSYKLNLDQVGIKRDERGKIIVDEYQNTNIPQVYSLGDIAEDVELTPVAIAAGRQLAERVFNGQKNAKLDYTNIPSAIFSHPEAGSIGISEKAARDKYGDSEVKVYQSKFINMFYAVLDQEQKQPTVYKLVVVGKEEKVVGLHLVGDSSSEILQGFGVAIKMGATKADFDRCVAIHPTAAEEIVTLK